jgi:hypothetical protein
VVQQFVSLVLSGRAASNLNLSLSLDLEVAERRLSVMLGIERNIDAGSPQSQAKKFALARAVFDQEDGGVRDHNKGDISRECAGLEDE